MTIIAGFKCNEGIVICADTQETTAHSKRNVPKLRFEPLYPPFGGDISDLAVAFCGATDNASFTDKLVDCSWESAQTAASLDEACHNIELSIKSFYKEYGEIYQVGFCPQAELIYGVKMHDGSRMFHAYGPAVTEKNEYVGGGAGYYMADFLASRMQVNILNLRQCIILAAYILFQSKEHVDGCGGESHIAVLRNEGTSGRVDSDHVKAITELIQSADKEVGKILMQYADLALDQNQFKKQAREVLKAMEVVREAEQEQFKSREEMWSSIFGVLYDDFGLPLPITLPSATDKKEPDE